MDIYWIQDKQRRGPASTPDVITLVQMGEISADALGWHAGCKGWMPLRELPALADFLNELHETSKGKEDAALPPFPDTAAATKPIAPAGQAEEADSAPEEPQGREEAFVCLPRPSTRLVARLIDSGLYAAVAMGALYAFNAPFSEFFLPTSSFFWAPMVLIEAFCLCRRNATPGKALMGISVRPIGPQGRLAFSRALSRSIHVFILGMGTYLPFLAIPMLILSYFVLTRKGMCFWDLRASTLPVQKAPLRPGRLAIGIICIFMCAQLVSAFIRPWLPEMVQVIEQSSPETGRLLRDMIPASELPAAEGKEGVPQPLSHP